MSIQSASATDHVGLMIYVPTQTHTHTQKKNTQTHACVRRACMQWKDSTRNYQACTE